MANTVLGHAYARLTAEELTAVEVYAGNLADPINNALRRHTPLPAELAKTVGHLRSAILKHRVPEIVRVTRKTDTNDLYRLTGQYVAELEGQIIRERGFLSTSGVYPAPQTYLIPDGAERVELDIVLPADTPALRVHPDVTHYPLEQEVLVIDDRRYYIDDIRFDDATVPTWQLRAYVV